MTGPRPRHTIRTQPDGYDRPDTPDVPCAADPELMHPVNETPTSAHGRAAIRAARDVCTTCPATTHCLTIALADPTLTGIWAGTTTNERDAIRRHRAVG